jgi:hypothetical protein
MATAAVVSLSCGGTIQPGGGGSSSSAGGSTGGGDSFVDSGSDAGSEDGSSSPIDGDASCVSSYAQLSHSEDGGCGAANAGGVCGGDILELDCICPHDEGMCFCQKNNKQVATVGYDCTACEAVGSSWTACGFPPM